MRRSDFNTSASGGRGSGGIFRAQVVSVGADNLLRVKIPKLGLNNIYEGIPIVGPPPAVNDLVYVGFLEGKSGSFVAFTSQSDTVVVSITLSDDPPASAAAGDLWFESDTGKTFIYYDSVWTEVGSSIQVSSYISDVDGDTQVKVEESVDEDAIRFDTAGTERMVIDSTGNLAFDTDTLYVDATNNRVGIGTTAPASELEISTATGGGASATELRISSTGQSSSWSTTNPWGRLDFWNEDDSGGGRKSHASLRAVAGEILGQYSDLEFHVTDGSAVDITAMTIQGNTGRVGIGTTTPDSLLHLNTSATTSTELLRLSGAWSSSGGQFGYIVGETNSDGGVLSAIGLGVADNSGNANDGGIVFQTTSGATTNVADLTTRMVIDHVGQVGIGTTSPDNTFMALSRDNRYVAVIDSGVTNRAELGFVGTSQAPAFGYLSGYDISFRTATTRGGMATRMYIDETGLVGIGTTAPLAELDITNGSIAFGADSSGNALAGPFGLEVYNNDTVGLAASLEGALYYRTSPNVWVFEDGAGADILSMDTDDLSAAFGGDVSITGALSKGSGTFRISHPLPELNETHQLVHSFIEGPQADNIYRGRVALVEGTASVNIDEASGMTDGTFVLLNRDVQAFTSNEEGPCRVWSTVNGNVLSISAEHADCSHTISWMVIGERQDQHMYDTYWTDDEGRVITEPEKDLEVN